MGEQQINADAGSSPASSTMKIIQLDDKEDVKVAIHFLRDPPPGYAMTRGEREIIMDVGLAFFRGSGVWIGVVDGGIVTLNATYFGKRKKNAWEPYANVYTAFTRPDVRRRGYAKQMGLYVQTLAMNAGCRRLRSLAGSILGVHYHRCLGHEFWARTDKNEVVVDTPLVIPSPEGIPSTARKWITDDRTVPLTVEEALAGPFRYEVLLGDGRTG